MAKWIQRGKQGLQYLLENLQVLLESYIILLVGKYFIFGGKAFVNKLWPLLYNNAELDLRLTIMHFVWAR